jgi:hypothetical protein
VFCGFSPATPRINQYSPLGRLTPCPTKQNKTKQNKNLNNKQGTENYPQQKGWGAVSTLEWCGGRE